MNNYLIYSFKGFDVRKKIDIERIYQVALNNFSKAGYQKTTLDEIAKDLGVTKSNLYLYARNKHSLYDDSVAYALKKWQYQVKTAIQFIEDPRIELILLCNKSFEYLAEDKIFCEILKKDPEIFPFFSEDDRYQTINEESIHMIKSIILKGIEKKVFKNVDAEHLADVFFSIYKMFIIQAYIKNENTNVSSVFLQTLDLLTTGLFMHD